MNIGKIRPVRIFNMVSVTLNFDKTKDFIGGKISSIKEHFNESTLVRSQG